MMKPISKADLQLVDPCALWDTYPGGLILNPRYAWWPEGDPQRQRRRAARRSNRVIDLWAKRFDYEHYDLEWHQTLRPPHLYYVDPLYKL